MSYILDALQRAQAERSRGQLPGLHSPAADWSGAASSAPAQQAGRWAWPALLALLLLAGAGLWWWLLGGKLATPASPPAAPPALTPEAAAMPALPEAAAPTAAAANTPIAIQREAVHPVNISAPEPVTVVADAPVTPPAKQAKAEKTTAADSAAAQPSKPPSAEGTVFSQDRLPPAVRAQLPTLDIAGLSYSSNRAHRMVIVNGQVLREGDQAAPGLLLQAIEPQRTVWGFQGYRYALPAQASPASPASPAEPSTP